METPSPGFQPTLWSVVLRAKDACDPRRRSALNRLCDTYWSPVYVYLRRKGLAREDAEDAVQGFFTHFLEKEFLDRVDPSRGRFKNYLLAVLEHYLANEHRHANAEKRGGGKSPRSLDFARAETEVRLDPADPETPESAFRKSWGLTILQNAFDALRREFADRGRTDQFEVVRSHLAAADRSPYDQIAVRLGCSVADVTNLLHRSKKRLRELIQFSLRETVETDEALQEEMRELLESL